MIGRCWVQAFSQAPQAVQPGAAFRVGGLHPPMEFKVWLRLL